MAINMQDIYSRSPGVAEAESPDAAQASTAGTSDPSTGGSKAAQAFNASSAGYSAKTQDVSPEAMADVQATKIMSQDSPLMQRAKQEGMLSAGRRGLQNSSISVGAAQGAMADRAVPLAQQNAQHVFQQDLTDQAAENRATETTAAFEQEAAKLNAQLNTAVSQGNAAAENAARQQLADLETRTNMQKAEFEQQTNLTNAAAENQMRQSVMQANADLNKQYLAGTQALDLATIQGQYNQLISTNETAARMYDSYFNSISQTMANKDIPPDRVAQYVRVQQSMLEAGLRVMDQMNSLNLDTTQPGVNVTGSGKESTIAPGTGTEGPGTNTATPPVTNTSSVSNSGSGSGTSQSTYNPDGRDLFREGQAGAKVLRAEM